MLLHDPGVSMSQSGSSLSKDSQNYKKAKPLHGQQVRESQPAPKQAKSADSAASKVSLNPQRAAEQAKAG